MRQKNESERTDTHNPGDEELVVLLDLQLVLVGGGIGNCELG
jgi:hypothetical protein